MTPREKRHVLVGAAIIALAIAGRAAVRWHTAWNDLSFRLSSAERLVQAARLMKKELPSMRANTSTDSSASEASESALLDAGDEATATVRLAERLAAYADASGTAVTSIVSVNDSTKVETLRRLSIRAHVSGDLERVQSFLLDIVQPTSALAVAELTIRAPVDGADAATHEALDVDVLVTGWYRERQR
jgi:hypothetical protein